MKRALALLAALTMALSLFACASQPAAPAAPEPAPQTQPAAPAQTQPAPAQPQDTPAAQDEVWSYALRTETTTNEYKADDGTVIATSSYEQPVLVLVNASGEEFAGSTPERGVTAEQLAACKKFNDETGSTGLWTIDLEAEAKDQYAFKSAEGIEMLPLVDEVTLEDSFQNGDLLSVLVSDYANLGGAHPDYGVRGWSFDLAKGEFFTLAELSDQPEAMKQAIADEIVRQIGESEMAEGFYENYAEVIAERDFFEAFFGEDALTVWFQEYELGPHAIGAPTFEIPYSVISGYLTGYGAALLG